MNIHKIIESIFGSPARVNILRRLVKSPQPLSGRQIGELTGLTHKGAIHAMESLVELGAVKQRRVGRAYQYSLSKKNIYVKKIIIPCVKAEAELFDNLKKDIVLYFGSDAVSLILYGSLARGEGKKGSDIDVMVITSNERRKSTVAEKVASKTPYFNERFNRLLSLHCFTAHEIKNKKNLPMIKSVIKEGIVLSGKPLKEFFK